MLSPAFGRASRRERTHRKLDVDVAQEWKLGAGPKLHELALNRLPFAQRSYGAGFEGLGPDGGGVRDRCCRRLLVGKDVRDELSPARRGVGADGEDRLAHARLAAQHGGDFVEFDAEAWDRQLEEDIASGRLDKLGEEAIADLREGRTRPL